MEQMEAVKDQCQTQVQEELSADQFLPQAQVGTETVVQSEEKIVPPAEFSTEKIFYSIGEVADMSGVEPYVLRYWESEFKILHPNKRASGQRSYQKRDIETVLMIKKLLYGDLYTIAGARKKLREQRSHAHGGKPGEEPLMLFEMTQAKLKDEKSLGVWKDVKTKLENLKAEIERN